MKQMRAFLSKLAVNWKLIAMIIIVVLITAGLLGYKLGRLTSGLSGSEFATANSYQSLHTIYDNPLHLPYKLVGWAVHKIPYDGLSLYRVPSVIFGVATIVAFAVIVRRWYGARIALLGTAIFMTSAWFLHVSRLASFQVEFLWASVTLLALNVLLHAYAEKVGVFLLWCAGVLCLLFVPGMVWLLLVNIIFQRDDLIDAWQSCERLWQRLLVIIAPLLVVGGFGYLLYRQSQLVLEWLGIPADFAAWHDMLYRAVHAFSYFVFRGPNDPTLWLGRLPILNIFMTVMLLAGIIFYARHLRAWRSRFILTLFLIGAALSALSASVEFSLLVPFVYLVALAGIASLLHQWLKVFPRNPLARSVGIGLVAIVVVASVGYNLRSYYIAWPHNSATRAAFVQYAPPK
jgi:hypothetical protein